MQTGDKAKTARFRRATTRGKAVRVTLNGAQVEAFSGDTVAAMMLVAGTASSQVNKHSGAPRGPYCHMGVCFECLVTIDDVPDCQACMVPVREGMTVHTQMRQPGKSTQ